MSGMHMVAARSLRHRTPTFFATFAAIAMSSLMVGTFAGLAQTGQGDGIPDASQETLTIMGIVIGSWGAVLAMFAVASTLSVAVRRRDGEIALLRSLGATPRQARALIRREVLVVGAVAALTGAVLAGPAGVLLLDALRDAGMVAPSVQYGGGLASLGGAAFAVLLVSLLATGIASRRATAGSVRLAQSVEVGAPRRSRWRTFGGLFLIVAGLSGTIVTITVTRHDDDPYAAMQTSGSAGILVAVGLAAFAPVLLRRVSALLLPLMDRLGVAGHLASLTAHRRSHLLGGVLGPVMVFTASATGVLMVVGIDGRNSVVPPEMTQADVDSVTLLNNVVVGMIAAFCALVLVNALMALIADRRAEFGRLRLVGGTPDQIRAAVLIESMVVAAIGVGMGLLASCATVVPFAIARDEGLVPNAQLWLPVAVSAVAVALTVGAASLACRRVLDSGTALAAVGAA